MRGEGKGANKGGASVPDLEAGVRRQQGALPGAGEERAAAYAASGFFEPDDCPAALVVKGDRVSGNLPENGPAGAETEAIPPQTCIWGFRTAGNRPRRNQTRYKSEVP